MRINNTDQKIGLVDKANFFLIQKKPSDNDLKEISVRKNIICFPDIDESEKPFLDSIEMNISNVVHRKIIFWFNFKRIFIKFYCFIKNFLIMIKLCIII